MHPQFDAEALKAATPIGKGLPASPGAACGKVVFTADDAAEWGRRGEKVILVRLETSPEDIEGMHFSEGILTVRGGMTSHAAVVARGMGTCCVCGCGDIVINEEAGKFTFERKRVQGRRLYFPRRFYWQHIRGGYSHSGCIHFRQLRQNHEMADETAP